MTPPLKRLAAGLAVATLLASGAACTKDGPVANPTTTPPATSETPSPSPSATATSTPKPTLSQRAQAEADAIAMVKKYYIIDNAALRSPTNASKTESQLRQVASGTALFYAELVVARLRSNEQHQTGDAVAEHIVRASVDLTFRPTANPPRIPTVTFRLCRDVTSVDLIGKDGKSAMKPGRQNRVTTLARVSNFAWPNRSGWRVSSLTDEAESC